MNQEIVDFIVSAAQMRGINPWIALAVADSEGGLDAYALHGDFETGDSWWAFQLHYGGAGYERYGTVAGMGNGFTALTGWAPGDTAAWKDATRYALNRAKRSGWGAWYGAQALGLTGREGISDSWWDANTEAWDYESGHQEPEPPLRTVVYDASYPGIQQNDPWSCGPTSARWGLLSVGRHPSESWIESTMIAEGVANPNDGITDASGAGLARFITEQYGEFGFSSTNSNPVSFGELTYECGKYPMMIGGRRWGHWSGLRYSDPGTLYLANPAEGWMGVSQVMNEEQFNRLGPFSCVRILHQDLL